MTTIVIIFACVVGLLGVVGFLVGFGMLIKQEIKPATYAFIAGTALLLFSLLMIAARFQDSRINP